MPDFFKFHEPGRLVEGELELALVKMNPYDPLTGWVPDYHFEMRPAGEATDMGAIRLRIGSNSALRYAGHIGYEVKAEFRGHSYAARACRLLFPLAYSHGLKRVSLNVDPRNAASISTCRKIGAVRVETIHIKKDHPTWANGTRFHRRYWVELDRALGHNKPEAQLVDPANYISQTVYIKIDRKLGFCHPRHPDLIFSLNYGYVPGTLSGDGDELDAYLLGVSEPVSEYTGKCLAVIIRRNENDPKLVMAPEGREYNDQEIQEMTAFLERFHDSYIVRQAAK